MSVELDKVQRRHNLSIKSSSLCQISVHTSQRIQIKYMFQTVPKENHKQQKKAQRSRNLNPKANKDFGAIGLRTAVNTENDLFLVFITSYSKKKRKQLLFLSSTKKPSEIERESNFIFFLITIF